MNHLKNKPEFIDIWIQKMQISLYGGLNFPEFNGYGRCYVHEKNNKTLPMHFVSGFEYKEVLLDDAVNGHFFCIENKEAVMLDSHRAESELKWIFFLNLKKLYPAVNHRADAEARKDIIDQIQKVHFFDLTKIVTGIDAISEFDFKTEDMQPWYIASFIGKLKYKYHNC